jgi:hypothetical protein
MGLFTIYLFFGVMKVNVYINYNSIISHTFFKNSQRYINLIIDCSIRGKCMVGWTKKWQEFTNLKVHFLCIFFEPQNVFL